MTKKTGACQEARWKETQSNWDDSAFLAERAGALDFLRWDLLELEVARRLAGLKGKLLDAGAGTGRFSRAAGPELSYFALEPSGKMILKAGAELASRFARGRNEEMPFADAAFQAVVIKETLDHCFDSERVLAEAMRVLAPGGRLVVTVHSSRAYYRLLFGWMKKDDGEHLFHFYPGQLKKLLRNAGLEQVRLRCYNYLRLPKFLENLIYLFGGRRLSAFLLKTADAIGRLLLPGLGGGVMVWGVKRDEGESREEL